MNFIRAAVSENRRRFVDQDVNLDLSYIMDNIIAMSYPSDGLEGLFRNPYLQVKKFLDGRHWGHYKVYNLRSEKQYDLSRFDNAANFPFHDHQAPPFSTLVEFCQDASDYLKKEDQNVIAIHCKAGKGRTGTVIAALLLHLGITDDANKAMEIYGLERTDNTRGVTIPSQRRYVRYYDFMLRNKDLYQHNKDISVNMIEITLHQIPTIFKDPFKEFQFQVLDINNQCIYSEKSNVIEMDRSLNDIVIKPSFTQPFHGDFKLLFLKDKGKELFSLWLNSTFIYIMDANLVQLDKKDIDITHNVKSCKEIGDEFSIEIKFSKV